MKTILQSSKIYICFVLIAVLSFFANASIAAEGFGKAEFGDSKAKVEESLGLTLQKINKYKPLYYLYYDQLYFDKSWALYSAEYLLFDKNFTVTFGFNNEGQLAQVIASYYSNKGGATVVTEAGKLRDNFEKLFMREYGTPKKNKTSSNPFDKTYNYNIEWVGKATYVKLINVVNIEKYELSFEVLWKWEPSPW